ncbi:energy transducer TonB [Methylobacter tundripaludum]|uniref:TonB family protein n=2 Tax=Methylobacter tundripaludum TaxID=173365 RepID=G3IUQ3_METTV|nr:TonB family protein [Methylobacter tundripaludum]EGW22776.1 TonB family protein [Methylobacter tundripaludum SV96]PPK77433.1 protein TonB [Methylobacter tundripaludum]
MRENQVMFDPPAPLSNNDSLLVALFLAAVIHVVIGLGINFTAPQPEQVSRSIDITLVNMPTQKAPEKAQLLAQENQLGAGEQSKKPEPPPQQLPSQGNNPAKQVKKSEPEHSEPKAAKKLITQKKAEKKIVTASKPDTGQHTEKHPQLTAEMLQQQIAQLGTEIRLNQQTAEQTKIKFVDSVSAHKYVAAQYMKDWEDKVERTGNLNYPEVAAKKNFSGTLTMDVGIKADGSIYSIRINQSSGNPALDEAAKKIVRMSAPFAPLPVELQKELDVLVITRVWKFSDESGMTSR